MTDEDEGSRYVATIVGNSISSAHFEEVGDDLSSAKNQAYVIFGGGFLDDKIVIYDTEGQLYKEGYLIPVASMVIGEEDWLS